MPNRIGILFLAFLLLFTVALQAQAPATAAHASHEDVLKLMKIMKSRETAQTMIDAMMTQMTGSMKQAMKEKDPTISDAELTDLAKIITDSIKDMPLDQIVDAMIPAYEKNLTQREVQAMIVFYSSPEGASVLAKMPQIGADSMKAMQPFLLDYMSKMEATMQSKMEEMRKKYHHEDKNQN